MKKRIVRAAMLLGGAAIAAYPVLWRERCLTWGATEDEAHREMPGDDLLADPDIVATRAVTVAAQPSAIWPWLVQMGPGRGGAYTYDWIENLFGLNMQSADEILPEFQNLKAGDVTALGTKGPRMRVEIMVPEHALVFRSEDGRWVWAFGLYREGAATRLVSRNRISTRPNSAPKTLFNVAILEPGSLIMERKMLLGIRERAERLARQATSGNNEAAPATTRGQT